MPSEQNIAFIRSVFPSIWSLEVLLLLAHDPARSLTPAEIVAALRANERIVGHSLDSLMAAGLVLAEDDGTVRFQPASTQLAEQVQALLGLYAVKPDKLRRLIVSSRDAGIADFAAAFKIRRD